MQTKSNKVLSVLVLCFYMFALGSFGIRARWIFGLTLVLSVLNACLYRTIRIVYLGRLKKRWVILYIVLILLIALPNARRGSDVINFAIFVSIVTFSCIIAKTNVEEIIHLFNIIITAAIFFSVYISFFRIFPGLYKSTIYRLLDGSVKSTYDYAIRFGYGFPIGNGYTFADSAIVMGVYAIIGKDLSEGEKNIKNKLMLVIMFAGVLLEGRKGELLSCVITVIFLYYIGSDRSLKRLITRLMYIILAIIIGVVVIKNFSNAGLLQRFTVMFERILMSREGQSVDFTSGRMELWEIAFNLFKDNPIVGIGWGKFANYVEGTYNASLDTQGLKHAHNVPLQFLCDSGIIGTTLISVPVIGIARYLFRNANYRHKNNQEGLEKVISIFSAGIMFYTIILSFVDPNFYGQYYWYMLAIVVIISEFNIIFQSQNTF